MTLMCAGKVVLCLPSECILLRGLVFLTQYLLNKTFSGESLQVYHQNKEEIKRRICFNYPNNESCVSHNPNHLIDSCNLFYCIAAVVPC